MERKLLHRQEQGLHTTDPGIINFQVINHYNFNKKINLVIRSNFEKIGLKLNKTLPIRHLWVNSSSILMSANNEVVSVVEDELDITNLFHDALEKTIYGVSVVSFTDSVRAFKHFKKNKKNYRLVIADWRMPNLDGLELLKKVKKLNPNVRTILISAYEVENEPLFQRFLKDGIIDKFIQKPMTMNYLCNEVNYQLQASTNE